jgi:hypothetical protein
MRYYDENAENLGMAGLAIFGQKSAVANSHMGG